MTKHLSTCCTVAYKHQKVFIRAVLTHAEYDKQAWKNDPWFS